jgi:hypothetical protein
MQMFGFKYKMAVRLPEDCVSVLKHVKVAML